MSENTTYNILIGISILAIIIVAVFIFSTPVKEPFTELYFEDFKNLPKTIEIGKDYQFSFTIHNKEGQGKSYPTTVTLDLDGNLQTLYSQEVFIADEGIQSDPLTFNVPQNFTKGQISVQIPDHEIHFWVSQK